MSDIFEHVDKTMEIYHRITQYMIDFAKVDMRGQKIKGKKGLTLDDIENNRIIKELYEKLQVEYQQIEKMVLDNSNMKKEDEAIYIIEDSNYKKEKEFDSLLLEDIKEYIELSYLNIRYIDDVDEKGKLISSSIFSNNPFKRMYDFEYFIQQGNLKKIYCRSSFNDEKKTLSFKEKGLVLNDISEKVYLKFYSMKQIESYMQELEEEKNNIAPEKYKKMKFEYYQQKMICIYEYLNEKYLGLVRVNDIGKPKFIRDSIDREQTSLMLNMSGTEIDTYINKSVNECAIEIDKIMKEFNYTNINDFKFRLKNFINTGIARNKLKNEEKRHSKVDKTKIDIER